MSDRPFNDLVVLITGSSPGIGRHMALQLAAGTGVTVTTVYPGFVDRIAASAVGAGR